MTGSIIWFTGLSGAGKSTLAAALGTRLAERGRSVATVDGDSLRAALSRPVGFSRQDILENGLRAIAAARDARATVDVVLVSVITPFEETRASARAVFSPQYLEVFVSTSVEECRRRDTKGLYARQAAGALDTLIGVSPGAPFERPTRADVEIDTASVSVPNAVDTILRSAHDLGINLV